MMLTIKQPVHYGYRTVHDLPTPPRTSPPVAAQESTQKPLSALQKPSPPVKSMSGPHRGLPLPAAMALPQPPPAPSQAHQSAPGPPQLHSQAPQAPSGHSQALGALPVPPPWQGSDDSMKTWLVAKAEEERRKQEEEKTRQESLRLEQRKLEYDMLRTSLDRGIPPPMIPVVFAGMGGGTLSQAAMEWAQQYVTPQQAHPAHILPAQGPVSPEHRRDSQQYGAYSGVPSTPGSGPAGQGNFVPYGGPGSPTRPRAHTLGVAGPVARTLESSGLPRLRTTEMGAGPSANPSFPAHVLGPQQQQAAQQQEQSPSIYFHHWTPPTSQASSNQPESPRKRKATGPQQAAPAPTSQARARSPPFGHSGSSTLSNPPPGRRRGHSRQRSDISSYRPTARGRGETFGGPYRGPSPGFGAREGTTAESSQAAQQTRSSAHSVSSLLSDQPSSPRFSTSEMRTHQLQQQQQQQQQQQRERESERRNSPPADGGNEKSRSGGAPGPAAPRE